MPKYRVEEMTSEINDGAETYYDEQCPHGCEADECEGHFEDEDRLFMIHDLFDRLDGEGAGYFSEKRARLIADFMFMTEAHDAPST